MSLLFVEWMKRLYELAPMAWLPVLLARLLVLLAWLLVLLAWMPVKVLLVLKMGHYWRRR